MSAAAKAAGVSRQTVYNWLERGRAARSGKLRAFADAVDQAEAEAEVTAVACIRTAMEAGDWRAAVEYLKRRHPDRWGGSAARRSPGQ